jgi:RES domain-containing protein
VPGWDALDYGASQAFAAAWFAAARTAVLRVPSMIVRPFEWNLVVNPVHRDAERIQRSAAMTVAWDERLFGASVAPGPARQG